VKRSNILKCEESIDDQNSKRKQAESIFAEAANVGRTRLVKKSRRATLTDGVKGVLGHGGSEKDNKTLKYARGEEPVKSRRASRILRKRALFGAEVKHNPVSYTLVIHPPIIVENLLPEAGTFELMHATRRVVVWWGELQPGESVPVHTVGLDAPLLLLVNLGFCRTPHGEGALIHDGIIEDGKSKGELGKVMGISLHYIAFLSTGYRFFSARHFQPHSFIFTLVRPPCCSNLHTPLPSPLNQISFDCAPLNSFIPLVPSY
jgi:hypothetical protein